MKTRTLAAAFGLSAFVVASGLALAKPPGMGCHGDPDGHGQGQHGIERMMQSLDLDRTQRQEIRALMENRRDQHKELRGELREQRQALLRLDPSAADYAEQVAAISRKISSMTQQMVQDMGSTATEVFAKLTPEQQTEARQKMQYWAEHRGEGRHKGRHQSWY